MKKDLLTALFLYLFVAISSGHPFKPQHYVIVDTDGGIDDMRTICMLLASPDVRILCITASPGVLSADNAYMKVKSMVNHLHHEGILIGINETNQKSKNCEAALRTTWGDEQKITSSGVPAGTEVVASILSCYPGPVTLLCLASLKPLEEYQENIPEFRKKIKKVVWSNKQVLPPQGFNHELSPTSLEQVKRMGIPFEMVNGDSPGDMYYDRYFLDLLGHILTPYAIQFKASFIDDTPYHLRWNDEMIAMYLHYPHLFHADTISNMLFYQLDDSVSRSILFTSWFNILSGETIPMSQVLKSVPVDTSHYFHDVQPIMMETIRKYGKTEWVSCVLANELHRHLGVYAIIGVKMGTRALEYFGAGIDEMTVVSHTGLIPPFSCMNDGLQVSTGATLGHGLIKISTDTLIIPSADFTYMNRTIRIILDEEIGKKIASEIQELNAIYGLNDEIYWYLVRQLAINYWASFDRNYIFKIIQL